jgi:ABC-type molybdate transport system permease subunit
MNYYVKIPLFGNIDIQIIAGIGLYIILVIGMIAKTIYDQSENEKIVIKLNKLIRPVVVSPIVFGSYISLIFLKDQYVGFSITTALLAFQIGFSWQQVLEKKIK